MKEKMYRFMQGRYGNDNLNRFLLILSVVFWVISMFTSPRLYFVGFVGLALTYFRMLSRNRYKRAAENRAYLKYENAVKASWNRWRAAGRQRKTHHIYGCPSCKQKIRIPKGKGRIEITCPKCRHTFIKKS